MRFATRRRRARGIAAFLLSVILTLIPLAQARPGPIQAQPITELLGFYKGLEGGLYGEGRNEPPESHAEAALEAASAIRPLDRSGRPSRSGSIVLLAIGQSTTEMEFGAFQRLARDRPETSRFVRLVNGAQSGVISQHWAGSDAPWNEAAGRVRSAGLTPAQVQAVWIEVAQLNPWQYGPFPKPLAHYIANLNSIVRKAKTRFPNLRIAFLSSRIYAGYASRSVNPEPFAYESGFGVRMAIQMQMQGSPSLRFRSRDADDREPPPAPVMLWGPYLWANGTQRRADGMTWQRRDLESDGVHPSSSGSAKAGMLLWRFFTTNEAARSWFLKAPSSNP